METSKETTKNLQRLAFARWKTQNSEDENDWEDGLERPPKRRFSVSASAWVLPARCGVYNRHTFQRFPAETIARHWPEILAGYKAEQ
jgi:hypothetical protein